MCLHAVIDSSKREECMLETMDAISMVETIIDAHPLHSIIIGGDLNTELKGDSPFDPLWHDLTVKYNLSCCDQFISVMIITHTNTSLSDIGSGMIISSSQTP